LAENPRFFVEKYTLYDITRKWPKW